MMRCFCGTSPSAETPGRRNHVPESTAADRIRTCGHLLRRQMLYPAELQPQMQDDSTPVTRRSGLRRRLFHTRTFRTASIAPLSSAARALPRKTNQDGTGRSRAVRARESSQTTFAAGESITPFRRHPRHCTRHPPYRLPERSHRRPVTASARCRTHSSRQTPWSSCPAGDRLSR